MKEQLLRVLSSSSLQIEDIDNKICINKKEKPPIVSTGKGIPILESNKVKSLVASGLVSIKTMGNDICIHSDFPLLNGQILGKILVNGNKLRAIVGGQNIKIEEQENCLVISSPLTTIGSNHKLIEKKENGLEVKTLSSSGGVLIKETTDNIDISCKTLNNVTGVALTDIPIISTDYKVKALRGAGTVKLKSTNNYIEIFATESKLESHTGGYQLLDNQHIFKSLIGGLHK